MTKHTFTKLGRELDYQAYQWVLDEYPTVAEAIETEVLAGASVEDVRRFLVAHVGEHRQGFIQRCVGAARWLQGQKG
jgi:hypothetical protein